MDGAANSVVGQSIHVKGFVHHTLASKGAITVHQNAHVLVTVGILTIVLLGAHFSQNNGVNCLYKQNISVHIIYNLCEHTQTQTHTLVCPMVHVHDDGVTAKLF